MDDDNDRSFLTAQAWAGSSTDENDVAEARNFPDADYNVNLSFDEMVEFGENATGVFVPTESPPVNSAAAILDIDSDEEEENEEDYILGTLIVRVVAARDLPVVQGKKTGLFGRSSSRNRGGKQSKRGGTNPYALVRFGQSTQRTSQVFDTLDPTWPRGENMFLDVTHPNIPKPPSKEAAKRADSQQVQESQQRPASSVASSSVASAAAKGASHPGDPPQKGKAANQSMEKQQEYARNRRYRNRWRPDRPTLTVALFHSGPNGNTGDGGSDALYNPSKAKKNNGASSSGDSDDVFLGMTAVDVTALITGKDRVVDAWCPLTGGSGSQDQQGQESPSCGSVRIVCEYESSDAAPRPGDSVQFTGFCRTSDLYPLCHGKVYRVAEDPDEEIMDLYNQPGCDEEDYVSLSYKTPEGWICTYVAHRYMLMVVEERQSGALEHYQDEIITLQNRLSNSPLVHTIQDVTMNRIPDEGLVGVGVSALQGVGSIFKRWMENGVNTAVEDIMHATNLDGHNDVSARERLADDEDGNDDVSEDEDGGNGEQGNPTIDGSNYESAIGTESTIAASPKSAAASQSPKRSIPWEALPDNMPFCPITGEPMRDPVVAADGHTYERRAIARWLATSDKSPLTGSVLPHKNLVPNYMLVSSLQEAQSQVNAQSDESKADGNGSSVDNSAQVTLAQDSGLTNSASMQDLEDEAF